MSEFSDAWFKGVYSFDLLTSEIDPEGEWIGTILSPSEGSVETFRISFQLRASYTGAMTGLSKTDIVATLEASKPLSITGVLEELPPQVNASVEDATKKIIVGIVTQDEEIL